MAASTSGSTSSAATTSQRNWVLINITPSNDRRATRGELEAERDRLIAQGATREKEPDRFWGP